jgi:hypothetical protein
VDPRLEQAQFALEQDLARLQSQPQSQAQRPLEEDLQRKLLQVSLAQLPSNPRRAEYVAQRFLQAEPAQIELILRMLTPHSAHLLEQWWQTVNSTDDGPRQLRAACALAAFDPASGERWQAVAPRVVTQLLAARPAYTSLWQKALQPVRGHLLPSLTSALHDEQLSIVQRRIAAEVLADYAIDDPRTLATAIQYADGQQYSLFLPLLSRHGAQPVPYLTKCLATEWPTDEHQRQQLAGRQVNSATALLSMEHAERVWPLLRHSPDPGVRSHLIHRVQPSGVPAETIAARLSAEADVSVRRALLLCLGQYGWDELPNARRDEWLTEIVRCYHADSDPGVHAAARWTLSRWQPSRLEDRLPNRGGFGRTRWYVDSQDDTMMLIPAGQFQMGSPAGESLRDDNETPHVAAGLLRFLLRGDPRPMGGIPTRPSVSRDAGSAGQGSGQ